MTTHPAVPVWLVATYAASAEGEMPMPSGGARLIRRKPKENRDDGATAALGAVLRLEGGGAVAKNAAAYFRLQIPGVSVCLFFLAAPCVNIKPVPLKIGEPRQKILHQRFFSSLPTRLRKSTSISDCA